MITNILWKVKAKEQRSIGTKEKTQEEKEDNWYVISKVLKKNFHGEWHQKRFFNKTEKILLWKKKKFVTPWSQTPKKN